MNHPSKPTIVNVDINRTEPFICTCGNETFEAVQFFRRVPALLSPTMRAELVAVPAFRCTRCKKMVDMEKTGSEKVQNTVKTIGFIAGFVRNLIKIFRK